MELSEKEKKAIEWFKSDLEMTKEMGKKWGFQEEIKNNEIILNLIEKQQKEIKELKQNRDEYKEEYIKLQNSRYYNYISKDKIREKIEHYNNELEHIKNGEEFENEKPMYYWGKVALEILLEEDGDHIPRID